MLTKDELCKLLSRHDPEPIGESVLRVEVSAKQNVDKIVSKILADEPNGGTNATTVRIEPDYDFSVEIDWAKPGKVQFEHDMQVGKEVRTVIQPYVPRPEAEYTAPSGRTWDEICSMFRRVPVTP